MILVSTITSLERHQLIDPFVEGVGVEFWSNPNQRPLTAGEVMVALGTENLNYFQSNGHVPRNRTLTSLSGVVFNYGLGHVLFAVTLPYLLDTPEQQLPFAWTLRLASRLERTGSTEPVHGNYLRVRHFGEALAFLETCSERVVSLDLETTGLDAFKSHSWIVSIAITVRDGESYVVVFDGQHDQPYQNDIVGSPLREQIHQLLNDPRYKVRGANLKFDLIWIAHHWGIECSNFRFDTMLVGGLLNENRQNSLEAHAKYYLPDLGGYDCAFNAKYDKGKMDVISKEAPDEFVKYACGDTLAVFRVSNMMRDELRQDRALANFYIQLLHPAARVFEKVERRGMLVDRERYALLEEQLTKEIAQAEKDALSLITHRIKLKYLEGLKLSKAAVIKDFMFGPAGLNLTPRMLTGKTQQPATSFDHLMMFEDHPTAGLFIKNYQRYSKAKKVLSTYVVGFLKHLRDDGKFHPNYFLGAASIGGSPTTGRLSARNPAVQCLVGETSVRTDSGKVALIEIVERYERGESFRVLTHTGAFRRVVGVYRNGKQPVFEIQMRGGFAINCTENHPLLTPQGFIRTDLLSVGVSVYVAQGAGNETQPIAEEAIDAEKAGFVPYEIVSIKPKGVRETFDLTIDDCHSFVANGIVVHNTIPKRGIWAKSLRSAFVAPPGYVILQPDYCLRGDTLVDTVVGQVPVKNVPIGMKVFTVTKEGVPVVRTVIDTIDAGVLPAWELTLDTGETLVCSGEHEWLGYDGFKVRTKSILAGQRLMPSRGIGDEGHKVVGIRQLGVSEPMYCLTVEGEHTFSLTCGVVSGNSQGEVRIAACLANEKTMIEAYCAGVDIHALTAASAIDCTPAEFALLPAEEQARLRQLAKAVVFGYLFSMKARGFQEYARVGYGVKMSLEEAEAHRTRFFGTYSGLLAWHENTLRQAHRALGVRSPLGRIRHLPLLGSKDPKLVASAERQSINAAVQSTLSDMMLLALVELDSRWPDLWVFGMTHDSISLYVPQEEALTWAQRVKHVMENLPLKEKFGWEPQVPFVADVEISVADERGIHHMGGLKKMAFVS